MSTLTAVKPILKLYDWLGPKIDQGKVGVNLEKVEEGRGQVNLVQPISCQKKSECIAVGLSYRPLYTFDTLPSYSDSMAQQDDNNIGTAFMSNPPIKVSNN